MLVLEFESRRGEVLNLFTKIKDDQPVKAPSVGRHNSTQVDKGRKSWNFLAIKTQGTNSSGEGEEEPAVWPRIWVAKEEKKEGRRLQMGRKRKEEKKSCTCSCIFYQLYEKEIQKYTSAAAGGASRPRCHPVKKPRVGMHRDCWSFVFVCRFFCLFVAITSALCRYCVCTVCLCKPTMLGWRWVAFYLWCVYSPRPCCCQRNDLVLFVLIARYRWNGVYCRLCCRRQFAL